jgi:hypothetical protein
MIAHIYPSVLQAVSGRGYAGCLDGCFQGYQGEAMQDLGYELPRKSIPRTWVNKGKTRDATAAYARNERRTGLRVGPEIVGVLEGMTSLETSATGAKLPFGRREA